MQFRRLRQRIQIESASLCGEDGHLDVSGTPEEARTSTEPGRHGLAPRRPRSHEGPVSLGGPAASMSPGSRAFAVLPHPPSCVSTTGTAPKCSRVVAWPPSLTASATNGWHSQGLKVDRRVLEVAPVQAVPDFTQTRRSWIERLGACVPASTRRNEPPEHHHPPRPATMMTSRSKHGLEARGSASRPGKMFSSRSPVHPQVRRIAVLVQRIVATVCGIEGYRSALA